MSGEPTFTVLIDNYDYGAFLGDAIESALAQGEVEVVVVDDGSDDNSRDVAAAYASRIRLINKTNGGQGSAFNRGFEAVTTSHVVLLDADDRLLPGAVDRIRHALGRDPDAAMVLHRLDLVDEQGRSLGETLPEGTGALPSGDLTPRVLNAPDDIAWQPTSGMTVALDATRRVLPVPEESFRVCADAYLANTVGLLGPVAAVDEPGAQYRIHGRNAHYRTSFDLERAAATIRRTEVSHQAIRRLALDEGLVEPGVDLPLLSVSDRASRLVVRRLDDSPETTASGSVWHHTGLGLQAAWGRRDRSIVSRVVMIGWFVVAAVAPRSLLPRLAGLALRR